MAAGWLGCLLLAAVTLTLTESRVVFHRPDVLELDSPESKMLFVHEPDMEAALRMELENLEARDEGAFTPWLNMDHPQMSRGSTGDYEGVPDARYRQIMYGECLIPCEEEDITAMEVDVVDSEDD